MSDDAQPLLPLAALAQKVDPSPAIEATTLVDYHSDGHLLALTTPEDLGQTLDIVEQLAMPASTVVVVDATLTDPARRLTDTGVRVLTVANVTVTGYLGAFVAVDSSGEQPADLAQAAGLDKRAFDLVLDLLDEPVIGALLPPFGYFRAHQLDEALESLPDMVGEFEKPRYFDYRADVCAHQRSHIEACRRCMDVCATGAISSLGDGVGINPYLCQGCGSCATACPTGAMVYAYPKPADAIAETRRQVAEAQATVLMLHTADDQTLIDALEWPTGVFALAVEEVTAFGIDYWLAVLCAGVQQVWLVLPEAGEDPALQLMDEQISLLDELLAGLSLDTAVVRTLNRDDPDLADTVAALPVTASSLAALTPSRFATHNEKRQTIRSAIDALAAQCPPSEPVRALPETAPFGRIRVDTAACTLCMGCVSVCPGKALLDGQDTPALRMVEANCVQCGLCESACPESAITLEPRYLYDSLAARKIVTLNEEAPFHCVTCHKPFATAKMISRMTEKLADHWMFGDEKSMRRLKMCEDCRVKDMFADGSQNLPEVHRGA